jgi:hypothetical protein
MFHVPACERLSERIEGFKIIRVWRLWFGHNPNVKQAQLPFGVPFIAVGQFIAKSFGLWRGITSE